MARLRIWWSSSFDMNISSSCCPSRHCHNNKIYPRHPLSIHISFVFTHVVYIRNYFSHHTFTHLSTYATKTLGTLKLWISYKKCAFSKSFIHFFIVPEIFNLYVSLQEDLWVETSGLNRFNAQIQMEWMRLYGRDMCTKTRRRGKVS